MKWLGVTELCLHISQKWFKSTNCNVYIHSKHTTYIYLHTFHIYVKGEREREIRYIDRAYICDEMLIITVTERRREEDGSILYYTSNSCRFKVFQSKLFLKNEKVCLGTKGSLSY